MTPDLSSLGEHPNLAEILEVLVLAGSLTADQIVALASTWIPAGGLVAEARSLALGVETPHVVDAMSAQEAFRESFSGHLAGWFDAIPEDAAQTAMKAVFDTLAAVFSRPVLSEEQYAALLGPWRAATATA